MDSLKILHIVLTFIGLREITGVQFKHFPIINSRSESNSPRKFQPRLSAPPTRRPSSSNDINPVHLSHLQDEAQAAIKPTTIDRRPTIINHRPTTVDHRPTTIQLRPTTIDRRPTTIQRIPTTIQCRPTTIQRRPTTIDRRPTTIDRRPTTIGLRSTRIDYKPTTIEGRITTIDHRPTTIEGRITIIDHRPPTIDYRPTTIDHRPTTIDRRPTIRDQSPTTIVRRPTAIEGFDNRGRPVIQSPADRRPIAIEGFDNRGRSENQTPDDHRPTKIEGFDSRGRPITQVGHEKIGLPSRFLRNQRLTLQGNNTPTTQSRVTKKGKQPIQQERLSGENPGRNKGRLQLKNKSRQLNTPRQQAEQVKISPGIRNNTLAKRRRFNLQQRAQETDYTIVTQTNLNIARSKLSRQNESHKRLKPTKENNRQIPTIEAPAFLPLSFNQDFDRTDAITIDWGK